MKEKIRFLENSLLVNNEMLVFGDFHIGYEEYVYGKSVYPRFQLKEIRKKLENIFDVLKKEEIIIKKIIILGDLKHEFGEISDTEWKDTLSLLDFLKEKAGVSEENIILIKGNHDTILNPILEKRNIKLKDYYIEGNICFVHGDKPIKECKECQMLVIGHLHPAIVLKDKYKKEKFKCFLKGKWKRKIVYILPSFSPMSLGYDMDNLSLSDKEFLMFDEKYLKDFEVIIYSTEDNKEYNFGKLRNLIK
jgi:hypothetical protein